jgi:hypothetical protein
MELSLRARVEGLTAEALEAARVETRSVVRTWCMRGTMHLLAAEDVGWLLSALAPSVREGGWRWLQRRAGLNRERATRVLDEAHKILKRSGPLPRAELMRAVSARVGEDVARAAAGVVWLGGMQGRTVFGPDQGAKATYAALEKWLGRRVRLAAKPDHPRLARRYLRGYNPAAPEDLAAWWALPLGEARAAWAALEGELEALGVDGQTLWRLAKDAPEATPAAGPIVRLVPAFDQYFLGYKDRDFAVRPAHQKRIFHGGQMRPAVLVDGLAEGVWRYELRGRQMRIAVTPFARFAPAVRDAIAEEAEDIGRFYGVKAALQT